jgi:hypothetical protein
MLDNESHLILPTQQLLGSALRDDVCLGPQRIASGADRTVAGHLAAKLLATPESSRLCLSRNLEAVITNYLTAKLKNTGGTRMPDGAPKTETRRAGKREKFVELAESRTKNAIKAIRVIAKLGNKNAYEYTDADVNKIAKALTREIELMKARMSSTSGKESVEFTLG